LSIITAATSAYENVKKEPDLVYNYCVKKISILVANNCFGSCEGCYLDKRFGDELSANRIINFGKILKQLGYEEITLSGGDPLIRGDIYKIVAGLNELGFSLHLDTIGKPLLNDGFLKNFPPGEASKMITLIGVPFDGSTEEIFNQFRTNSPSIKKDTLEILELLDKHGFHISINTVVHSGNTADLQNIYNLITNFPNVERWELHQYAPLSEKSKQLKDKFEVSERDFEGAVAKIDNYKNIVISPKLNTRKLNFKYLDFNGDFIKVTGGIKQTVFNINDFSDLEIVKKISK